MQEQTDEKKTQSAVGSDRIVSFDRSAALKAAAAEVEKAKAVAKAVTDFHEASERIEEAQRIIAENTIVRRASVSSMREAGYSAVRIGELTGVSPSTVQKMSSKA